ncbi:MAG: M48 family metalloprotease [Gemmatimonadota bacterium]
MNNLKTFVLLAGLLALCLVVGQLLGGAGGLLIGGMFGLVGTVGSYWFSDRMVLRGYHAKLVTEAEAPELFAMVDRLRQRAGLPMPRLAIVPEPQPNAFATGRSPRHAVVAVTQGALQLLPSEELEGVLAHELGHVLWHPIGANFRDADFTASSKLEVEANRFAADLLMPEWMVQAAMGAVGYAPVKLASMFDVSTASMSYRLRQLKLL